MESVWTALIVAIASMVSPLLLAWVVNINSNRNKRIDWAREDEVAAKAAGVAVTLHEANAAANVKLDNLQSGQKEIHTLVNSNMTAALQAELDATIRELAMMREVIHLNHAAGREPSVDTLAAIRTTESKIAELQTALKERSTPK